jgi:hypothetical protein
METLDYYCPDLLDYVRIAQSRPLYNKVENYLLKLDDAPLFVLLEILLGHNEYSPNNGLHDLMVNLLALYRNTGRVTPRQRLAVHTHVVLNCSFFKG